MDVRADMFKYTEEGAVKGLCIGLGIGAALGCIVLGSMPMGLCIGISFGAAFGAITGLRKDIKTSSVKEELGELG